MANLSLRLYRYVRIIDDSRREIYFWWHVFVLFARLFVCLFVISIAGNCCSYCHE